MEKTENLKSILARQKAILSEFEGELAAIEGSDLAKENAELKGDIKNLRDSISRISAESAGLAAENAGLKNALYEQVYSEKVKIVNTTEQKLEIYFRSQIEGEMNRLSHLENNVLVRINGMRAEMARNSIAATDDIHIKLNELSWLLYNRVAEIRANAAQMPGAFTRQEREDIEALKREQVTDDQVRAVAKKNNFERFIGLNVFNAVGIFLLIVGAIVFVRFAYLQLTDLYKGILVFGLGGLMLVVGWALNRKGATVFSLGISSGGIGILYAAMALGYFSLNILDVYAAAAACVIITAGAFLLSMRYNSQVIAAFALIGGYLPMLSANFDADMLYGVMGYMIALNLFALLISFRKKWRVTAFIGLFLNIFCTGQISLTYYGPENPLRTTLIIVYIVFAFLIYTSIPVIGTYRSKEVFRKSDVVFLTINTIFSCSVLYAAFSEYGLDDWFGLLAIIFAAAYLAFGRVISVKFGQEGRGVMALFYLTGIAFVILFVPLQFGIIWLSLGWLVEGVLLLVYGILKDDKRFRTAGIVIGILCLYTFLAYDVVWASNALFVYKYLAVTFGGVAILVACIRKKIMSNRAVKTFKYFILVNVWIFTLYLLLGKLQDALLDKYGYAAVWQIEYLIAAAAIAVTFVYAYFFSRSAILADKGTNIISAAQYIIGAAALFALNGLSGPVEAAYLKAGAADFGVTLSGTAILVALGFLSVLAVRELMKIAVTRRIMGVEWYPLIVSAFAVACATQILIAQFGVPFSSVAISVIYVLTALGWIVFGFAYRYSVIRKFGLALALLSVVKLFIIDIDVFGLTQINQIISIFACGGTLVAISYVYQYFNKRLELKE